MIATAQASRGYLTASESITVFKRSLDQELGLATAAQYDDDALDDRTPRVFEAAYRIAARLDPAATSVSPDLLEAQSEGFSVEDRRAVALMLKVLAPHAAAAAEAERALASIDAPLNPATIRDARVQILLAKAEAQARAQLIAHPFVLSTGNPLSRLVNDDAIAAIRREPSPTPPPPNASTPTPTPASAAENSPYMNTDTRRFSEIIEPTIAAIQRSGDWNEDTNQRRTAMRAFAWATGDKRLCDYRPEDAEFFGQVLEHLPKTFHWGTPERGALSRPFAEVFAEIPKAQGTEKRSPRTLNRDLTTLSRVAGQLAKVAWKPKLGGAPIMNFNDFTAGVSEDINDPDRMPWTEENLRAAFSSPIYTGGGGCMKRFKAVLLGTAIWRDVLPVLLPLKRRVRGGHA